MELDIVGVFRSTNESEYLELMVTSEEVNLKDYAITDSTFDENGDPSNKQRHFFKFPQQKVIKDQKISFYKFPKLESRSIRQQWESLLLMESRP